MRMPFIGQDWRSPGEVWIKTIEGWEPMKLLRKSHFVRHYHSTSDNNTSSSPQPLYSNYDMVDTDGTHQHRVVVLPSSSSSSLSSSLDASSNSSSAGSSTDSDSEGELIIGSGVVAIGPSDPVPVLSNNSKTRHESGDSGTSIASSSSLSCSSEPTSGTRNSLPGLSVAEIIQRLQRSSSQPIPIDILKESSEQIEIYHTQPYYRITLNPTREVQGSNIISDAFYKLDFCNAIRDIRRFAYVSKLLHLLITQNLTSLSGNATKALFWMLEEIAKQVASNKQNIHVIRELLVELREIVHKYLCWGRPLGSTSLWEQHLRTMERICEMTDAIEIVSPEPTTGKPSWSELPEELIREILLRLSDYKDLERSAQACQRMNSLLNEEQHIWKQLVKYHFTKDQLQWALRMIKPLVDQQNSTKTNNKCNLTMNRHNHHHHHRYNNNNCHNQNKSVNSNILKVDDADIMIDPNGNKPMLDWEQLFHLLRKKFGLKEEYADCLFLCRYCRCLFWKSKNHPCILENPDLTRQVLVTSPLTGFTTQQNSCTKFPNGSSVLQQQNKNNRSSNQRFLSNQQPQLMATHSSETSRSLRSHSSSLPPSNSSQQMNSNPFHHSNNRQPIILPPHLQPLPGGPVIVQNIPFFEHPLVIQQRLNNDTLEQRNNDSSSPTPAPTTTSFQKAPLHVPITPQAFLKFFSL